MGLDISMMFTINLGIHYNIPKGKVQKKSKKKLTSVSFMYVCVAENTELLVFFTFFLHIPHRQFSFSVMK